MKVRRKENSADPQPKEMITLKALYQTASNATSSQPVLPKTAAIKTRIKNKRTCPAPADQLTMTSALCKLLLAAACLLSQPTEAPTASQCEATGIRELSGEGLPFATGTADFWELERLGSLEGLGVGETLGV